MKHTLRNCLRFIVLLILPLLLSHRAEATHIYGADFNYTWVSANTYTIRLTVYGDCAGSSFPYLNGATPEVQLYKNNVLQSTQYLSQIGGGFEVTPVCPSQASNTVCSNPLSTIPGVKRYIYEGTYNLGSTSTAWRFRFTGNMPNTPTSSSAGRSNSIGNINSGSVMALEAQLNNATAPNSSVNYTTIPTPFFCVNKAANYNPGAVDPNSDSLSFAMVAGLTAPSGTVTYTTGYSAAAPLAASPFSFTPSNGQISFTPTSAQQSLVVGQVNEYKNGVLVGTSMREMTFVVLSTCSNNPPTGSISNTSTNIGSSGSTFISACKSAGIISFNVNPTDADGDHINIQVAGLPAGATFNISGNNGYTPTGTFTWNLAGATPGVYNFFITFTDDGCSLSSKQTVAYTLTVYGNPQPGYALTSPATCIALGKYSLTPFAGNAPYAITVSNITTSHLFPAVTGTQTDSLAPGTYLIHTVSGIGCAYDTTVTIANPGNLAGTFVYTPPTCFGGVNGSIAATGTGGVSPYRYAIGSGAFSSANTFTGLSAGPYTVHIKDTNSCVLDTNLTLANPAQTYATVGLSKPPCNHFANGSVSITGYNTVAPYTYAIGSGSYNTTGVFNGLYSGPYTIHIKNGLGCIKDTLVILPDSIRIQATVPVTNALCFGNANGAITINANGAYPPYSYAIGSGSFGPSNTFTGLTQGTYVVHVLDTAQCFFDTTITITQPTPVINVPTITASVSCNGGANGVISVAASGGTPGYTYAIGSGAYSGVATFSGLAAGAYTLHVKDANGCVKDSSVTITQPTPIVIGWTFVSPNCSNTADGSVTLSGSGGTPGYTYSVDGIAYQASGTINGLAAGAHVLHVKDVAGCIKDSSINLIAPARLAPSAAIRKSTCVTLGDGKVTLGATGGTAGYTFAQGSGSYGASGVFTPLAAGSYTFHVKDGHGCITDTTLTITDSLTISGNVTLTNVVCFGQNNGSITVTGAGGQSAYTYALGSGAYGSSGSFTPLANAAYVLHIRDVNGCIKDTNLTITQPTLLVPSASVTNVLCNGAATGAVTIGATGGTPGYTFANGSGSYGASGAFTGLTAGTYTFHVKDLNNCISDTTVTITQPTPLAFTVVKTNVLCNGGSTGTVTITASGGTPGYTYGYDANAYTSSNLLTGMNAGIHTVHLKDANGCIKDTNINITEPTKLLIGYTSVQPLCNGDFNGSITISGSGGTPAYLYSLNSSAFSATTVYNGLSAGTYNLHIKDANGCTKDSTIVLGEPAALSFSLAISNVLCNGGSSGSITVAAGGGTPAYQYAIDANAFSAGNVLSGLTAGLHTVHLKDANGCIKDSTVSVTQPAKLNMTYSTTLPLCNGNANGLITIVGIGGTTPYQYALNGGAFGGTATFTGLGAGMDTLHIKDANGCSKDSIVTLIQPAALTLTATATNVLCFGGSTGTVTVIGAGGVPAYSYAYDGNAFGSSNILTGLNAGLHVIHLKDVNGCIKDTNITITQPTKLLMGYTSVQPLCNGDANGSIAISASGGTPAYLYSLNSSAFSATTNYTGLSAGAYVLHIKDANGCTVDSNITLGQPGALAFTLAISNVLCNGGNTGSVSMTASGGTPAYQYAIDANAFGGATSFTGLNAGLHIVHLKDANGCLKDSTISITQPAKLNLSFTTTQPLCSGGSNGSITIVGIGGTTAYQFALNGGAFGSSGTFNGLSAGADTLHIKDANGCSKDSIITLGQPVALTLTASKTDVLCNGGSSGSVTIIGAGGVTPYTYGYDGNPYGSSNLLSGLNAGLHVIHLKDANGCIKDTNITITEPTKLLIGYTSLQPLCNGDANGSITITASGGSGSYQFSLNSSSFSTSPAYTGLVAGTYVLHLKDGNGCTKDSTITLGQPAILGVTLAVTNVLCNGNTTGSVIITASGGTTPYQYALGTGAFSSTNTYSGLTAGSYVAHIKDANGCLKDTAFNISQPTKLNLSFTATQPLCNGGANGSITIAGIGGTTAYQFALNSGAFGSSGTFGGLSAGADTLHVKDANGCTRDSIITLGQPTPVTLSVVVVNVKCNGGTTGSVTVTAGGGIAPYTYAVNAGLYSSSNILSGLAAGTHTVHVKDANGCIKDSVLTITQPTLLSLNYTITTPLCNNDPNGAISVTGTGGVAPYTYSLNTSPYTASGVFGSLQAGAYTLHVKDANGCQKDSNIIITQPAPLGLTLAITPILCNGDTARVTVTATGGTTPYTYAYDARAFGSSNVLTGLYAGSHVIHLKDSNSCVKDTAIIITEPTKLTLTYTFVAPLCNGDTNGSLVITGSGGVGPYTYALNGGSYTSSGSYTNLGGRIDTLHVRDANGCQKDSIINFTQPAKLAFTLAVQNVLCNGGNTGQVTITATGGTAPYQYGYGSNPFGSSNVLTGFAIGTYIIHLKDANGCTKDTIITITQPAVLAMGYTSTQPLCNLGTDGKIIITGTGGTLPYSFAINTGAFGPSGTFLNLTAGSYALHLKDANGCTVDSNITLSEPNAIISNAAVKRPRCTPLVNGAVTIYSSGGTPGYTYAVNTGAYGASNVFNNLASGIYIFHTKDANGCIHDTTIGVQDSVFVHANYTVTNVTCYGGTNGAVSVTPFGGDPTYTFAINAAAYATTNPINNLPAGNHTLHVKDANGCILDTALAITQPPVIVPQATVTQPKCFGGKDGSIQMAGLGGTPNYTYAQGAGAYNTTGTFSNLGIGNYTIHTKDANGCIHDTIVTVTQPPAIVIDSIFKTDLLCYGDNSGTTRVYASGGTPPYQYAFDGTPYTSLIPVTGINAGNHTIHIQDANGCVKDTILRFNQPPQLHFTVPGIAQPTCEGMKDGSITIAAFGGTPQYVFAMDSDPFKTVNIYGGLGEGIYVFHVRDSNSCLYDTTITLTGYPHIALGTPEVTPPTCYGFNNGIIDLNATGGVTPLTYHIIKPSLTNNTGVFDTLRKGIYTFQITDAKGCRKDTTINMSEPDPLIVQASATPNDCEGPDNNGSAGVFVKGGTMPYAYMWSTGQNTDIINGVGNGAYWVNVVDANLCADSALAVVGYDNCCKPFLPDAFTPNGDGKNDIYRLRWKGDVHNLNFSIYNRYGERVFVSYQADVGWDGTYHGKPADMDVYFYDVKFDCGNKDGNRVEYKGDVTLIR